jgi:hypothetical protein
MLSTKEESGEQRIVVFAYFVTERSSVGVGAPPPPTHTHSLAGSRNNLCKDDSALFSRFVYALNHKMAIHNVTFTNIHSNFVHIHDTLTLSDHNFELFKLKVVSCLVMNKKYCSGNGTI